MLRKIISIVLAAVLILSFAACGKKNPENETTVPVTSESLPDVEKKIAVLVPAGSQFVEAGLAAKKLAAEYPEKIVIREFDNSSSLIENKNNLINVTRQIAQDSSFGAIVYSKAVRLTNEAMLEAQTYNPDLRLICIEPEASVANVSEKADAVLCVDWVKAAADIVSCAKAQGAKYFVMTSFNRHISGSSVVDSQSLLASTVKSALGTECKKQGIEFIYHNSLDPISSGGTEAVVKEIRESIARYKKAEKISGADVALFSTDYFIQKELVGIAQENGYIYIGPSFPTAFNGLGDILSVSAPSDTADFESYKNSIIGKMPEGLRAGIYSYKLETVLLKSAVHVAMDLLAGKTTSDNLGERVPMRINDAAANDKAVTVKQFGGYSNVFAVYKPAFEKIG